MEVNSMSLHDGGGSSTMDATNLDRAIVLLSYCAISIFAVGWINRRYFHGKNFEKSVCVLDFAHSFYTLVFVVLHIASHRYIVEECQITMPVFSSPEGGRIEDTTHPLQLTSNKVAFLVSRLWLGDRFFVIGMPMIFLPLFTLCITYWKRHLLCSRWLITQQVVRLIVFSSVALPFWILLDDTTYLVAPLPTLSVTGIFYFSKALWASRTSSAPNVHESPNSVPRFLLGVHLLSSMWFLGLATLHLHVWCLLLIFGLIWYQRIEGSLFDGGTTTLPFTSTTAIELCCAPVMDLGSSLTHNVEMDGIEGI